MEDVLAKLETDPGRLLREEQSANGSFQQLGQHQPSDEACRLAYSTEVIPRHLQWCHLRQASHWTPG